jgi:hypothetical protein
MEKALQTTEQFLQFSSTTLSSTSSLFCECSDVQRLNIASNVADGIAAMKDNLISAALAKLASMADSKGKEYLP